MPDKTFSQWLEELKPFSSWMEGLSEEEREWAEGQLAELRYADCPDAEALVRADFHSPYAEAARYKALRHTRECVERIWSLKAADGNLIDMVIEGKRLPGPLARVGEELRQALSEGLSRERASAIAASVARYTAWHVLFAIDNQCIGGVQGRQWLLMELYKGRLTGRQASGGKFDGWPGRSLYPDKTPFTAIDPGGG